MEDGEAVLHEGNTGEGRISRMNDEKGKKVEKVGREKLRNTGGTWAHRACKGGGKG